MRGDMLGRIAGMCFGRQRPMAIAAPRSAAHDVRPVNAAGVAWFDAVLRMSVCPCTRRPAARPAERPIRSSAVVRALLRPPRHGPARPAVF